MAIGRPSKRTPEVEQTIIRAIEQMCTVEEAAAIAGISHETVYAWGRDDPAFSDAVKTAQAKCRSEMKLNAFKRAMFMGNSDQKPETALTIFLLKAQCGMKERTEIEIRDLRPLPLMDFGESDAPDSE